MLEIGLLAIVFCGVWLAAVFVRHRLTGPGHRYDRPENLSADQILRRAFDTQLGLTDEDMVDVRDTRGGEVSVDVGDRELRRLAAMLTINVGERCPLEGPARQLWSALVRRQGDSARFSEHLLGMGGNFDNIPVAASVAYDWKTSRASFARDYRSLFS